MMTDMFQLFASVQDLIAAVTQELLVALVFFCSLLLWKRIGKRRSKPPKVEKIVIPSSQKATPVKKVVTEEGSEVLDSKSLDGFKSAETQMMKLLEQREFTRALNFFRTFERDGRDRHFSESLFSAFIQSAIRVGKMDVVDRLLLSMRRRGKEPTSEFWRTTLKILSSRKHFDACLMIHSAFERSLPADKIIYSCLINAALESGSPERATAMLDKYKEAVVEPRDHILLFRTYVATGDLAAAEENFQDLGENMTTLMLNLVLLTCVNAKQPQRAHELVKQAHIFEESRAAKTSKAVSHEGRIVDVVSYNTVMKGFAKAGMLKRCFGCLGELKSRGLEPDDVTLGTLLDMCIADNDISAANDVVELMVQSDRPVDRVMCTLLIRGFVRTQRLPKALELYEEMKRRKHEGAQPDIVTYSVLIKACVDAHDMDKALSLLEDMSAAGHKPDDMILTHLLEGCRYMGNNALGKRLFEDMLAAGVNVSEYTLITMVKLHGRCGAHEEAHNLVANWEKHHGSKPSVIHYTCLMSGCLRTKSYEQAWQAYQLMILQGVEPDETSLSTLVPGMVAAQQWERVLLIVKRAMSGPRPVPIAATILKNAFTQMRAADAREAADLCALMKENGVEPNSRKLRER